jgi:hypothetical protein
MDLANQEKLEMAQMIDTYSAYCRNCNFKIEHESDFETMREKAFDHIHLKPGHNVNFWRDFAWDRRLEDPNFQTMCAWWTAET